MAELPEGFEEKYRQLLGDEADAFIESFDKPVVKAFRQNPLKANMDLYDTKADGKVPWGKWGNFGAVRVTLLITQQVSFTHKSHQPNWLVNLHTLSQVSAC